MTVKLLEAVIRQDKTSSTASGPALAPRGEPWPETVAARDAVNRLLQDWDDAEADRLFTPNVAQDGPYPARRRAIELIRERIGAFGDDPDRPVEYDSPARCRWWLTGDRGAVQAQIMLNPEKPPRVQWISLAVPPAAGSPLADALTRVVGWLNGGESVPVRQLFPDQPHRPGHRPALPARPRRRLAIQADPGRSRPIQADPGRSRPKHGGPC